ncbi:MAG TPA: hypothetical protein QGF58_07350 [Myxococcota bacterium]|nr:hypothetical protein [Myxococcota bacterium]
MTLALALLGCASWVDGTWLFEIDQNADLGGTCAEDATFGQTAIGSSYQLVDIFEAADGSVIVFLDELLDGTRDGRHLTADWERTTDFDDGSSSWDAVEVNGDFAKGILTGQITDSSRDIDADGNETSCVFKFSFEAEQMASDDDAFVGD